MIDQSTGFQVGVFGESGRDANGGCTTNFGYYARNPLQKYVNWIDENVCRLTSIPRDRCQSFANTNKPTASPTTRQQNTLITYRFNVNTVYGFNDVKSAIAPTPADVADLMRLTEVRGARDEYAIMAFVTETSFAFPCDSPFVRHFNRYSTSASLQRHTHCHTRMEIFQAVQPSPLHL